MKVKLLFLFFCVLSLASFGQASRSKRPLWRMTELELAKMMDSTALSKFPGINLMIQSAVMPLKHTDDSIKAAISGGVSTVPVIQTVDLSGINLILDNLKEEVARKANSSELNYTLDSLRSGLTKKANASDIPAVLNLEPINERIDSINLALTSKSISSFATVNRKIDSVNAIMGLTMMSKASTSAVTFVNSRVDTLLSTLKTKADISEIPVAVDFAPLNKKVDSIYRVLDLSVSAKLDTAYYRTLATANSQTNKKIDSSNLALSALITSKVNTSDLPALINLGPINKRIDSTNAAWMTMASTKANISDIPPSVNLAPINKRIDSANAAWVAAVGVKANITATTALSSRIDSSNAALSLKATTSAVSSINTRVDSLKTATAVIGVKVWSKTGLVTSNGVLVSDTFSVSNASGGIINLATWLTANGFSSMRLLSITAQRVGVTSTTFPIVSCSISGSAITVYLMQPNVAVKGIDVFSSLIPVTDPLNVKILLTFIAY